MFHVKLFRGFFPHLFVDIDEEQGVFTVHAEKIGARGKAWAGDQWSPLRGDGGLRRRGRRPRRPESRLSTPFVTAALRLPCHLPRRGRQGRRGRHGRTLEAKGRRYEETPFSAVGAGQVSRETWYTAVKAHGIQIHSLEIDLFKSLPFSTLYSAILKFLKHTQKEVSSGLGRNSTCSSIIVSLR